MKINWFHELKDILKYGIGIPLISFFFIIFIGVPLMGFFSWDYNMIINIYVKIIENLYDVIMYFVRVSIFLTLILICTRMSYWFETKE